MNIPVYDGASKDELETWLDQIEIACQIAGREQDIKKVALGKSKVVALDALRSLDNAAPWSVVKDELRRCFSEDKTRVHSATLLNDIRKQQTGKSIHVYICRASARPPAFLPIMPRIPSRLERNGYRSLNRVVYSGRNLDSSHGLRPQPIRGLPTIQPGTF